MKVFEIRPNGLCGGVKRAIKMISDALDNPNTKKPIYMLGNLIHNKQVVNSLVNKGIILVKDNYLDFLDTVNSGTIVFTAHGISPIIFEKAKNKGLDIIDTTCIHVLNIHKIIKSKIDEGKDVIVVGNQTHPEVLGYLGISPNVHVYNDNLDIKDGSFVVNQTTLVYDEVLKVFDKIKNKNPNVDILEEICDATKRRQNALKKELDNYEAFIIVGDKLSNNSRSLLDLVIKNNKLGHLVEKVEDLKDINLSGITSIGITSGASTPPLVVDEVIKTLENIESIKEIKSILVDDDYIKI